uniref:Uncharacterized protein n=1 Tax=Octopus bimaculoides TaxID=37653 RepID=A0A0L8H203_OCTBM
MISFPISCISPASQESKTFLLLPVPVLPIAFLLLLLGNHYPMHFQIG